jgi:hypothetical protein
MMGDDRCDEHDVVVGITSGKSYSTEEIAKVNNLVRFFSESQNRRFAVLAFNSDDEVHISTRFSTVNAPASRPRNWMLCGL